jgi:hypothetical protein
VGFFTTELQRVIAIKHGLPQSSSHSLCHFLMLDRAPHNGRIQGLIAGKDANGSVGSQIVGMHQHS